MHKGHFNRTAFIKTRVAQTVAHQATKLKVVGSSPTVAKYFHFVLFFAFDALLAGRPVQYK